VEAGGSAWLYLIRPDGYVALRTPLAAAQQMQAWLQDFAAGKQR
jgi:hypothetical protein